MNYKEAKFIMDTINDKYRFAYGETPMPRDVTQQEVAIQMEAMKVMYEHLKAEKERLGLK